MTVVKGNWVFAKRKAAEAALDSVIRQIKEEERVQDEEKDGFAYPAMETGGGTVTLPADVFAHILDRLLFQNGLVFIPRQFLSSRNDLSATGRPCLLSTLMLTNFRAA